MSKSKTTKRALLLSVISMLLCLSMLVGSTFAWFTDSVNSGKNKIVAGNLDVELQYSTDKTTWYTVDENTNLFKSADETLWEPGHTEYVYLRVCNEGSLALRYQLSLNVFGDENGGAEKTFVNKNGTDVKLSSYLVFNQQDGLKDVTKREDLWLSAADEAAAMGKLTGLGKEGELNPGFVEELTLAVYMPTSVGNEANQLTEDRKNNGAPTIYLGLNLFATQVEDEEDSFGNDYDENAWLDHAAENNGDGTVDIDGKDYIKDGNEYVEVKKNEETGLYETVVPEGETPKNYVSDDGTMVEVEAGEKDGLYQEVTADGADGKLYAQGSEGVVPVAESETTPGLYEEVGGDALFLARDNDVAEVEEEVPGLYNTVVGDEHYVNDNNNIVQVETNPDEYGLYQPVAGESVAADTLYAKASDGVVPVEKTTTDGLYTEKGGNGQFAATADALTEAANATPADGEPLDINLIQNIDETFTDGTFNPEKALALKSDAAIDLAGNELNIQSQNGGNGIKVDEGASATISNGTITMDKAYGTSEGVVDAYKSEITLDNMTVTNTTKTGVCVSAGSDGGKVIIKNSTITGSDSPFSAAVFCASQSTVVIENSTIVGAIRAGSNSKVELRGGDYTKAILRSENKDRIIIYSGLFSVNPTIDPGQLYTHGAKLAPGSTLTENPDGTWTVTAAPTAG